jgi:hypothetical protein
MRNWKQVAEGLGTGIPEPQAEKIAPILDDLEAVFAPLKKSIPIDTEPATVFRPLDE